MSYLNEPYEENIWQHFPIKEAFGDRGKYRIMKKIKTPPFISPTIYNQFMRGNHECTCFCKSKYLPRNAILVKPKNKKDAEEIYNNLVFEWKKGTFKFLAQGSCQQAINIFNVKKHLRPLGNKARLGCIDNVDNSQLEPGDILLTRHGERTVGKPHLVLK